MTHLRRGIIAGIVTFCMPLVTIGAPIAVHAAHVGGSDQATVHVYSEGSR